MILRENFLPENEDFDQPRKTTLLGSMAVTSRFGGVVHCRLCLERFTGSVVCRPAWSFSPMLTNPVSADNNNASRVGVGPVAENAQVS